MTKTAWFQENWFFTLWCAFLASMLVRNVVMGSLRKLGFQKFAEAHRLGFRGDLLPSGLLIVWTSFGQKQYSISNCVSGELRGIPLCIFDLSYRKGKGQARQTVVGFPRSGVAGVSEAPVDDLGSFEFEGAGEWVIGYVSKRLVTLEELEDWCLELHALALDLLADAKGQGESRPRLFRLMA